MDLMYKQRKMIPLAQRFWPKVLIGQPLDCWLWTGSLSGKNQGYGQIQFAGRKSKRVKAHRVAFELTYGPVPPGQFVLHQCDTPLCCNPEHLFLGTTLDNKRDSVRKERHARGEMIGAAKLTERSVLQIRELYAGGYATQPEMARLLGVSPTTIWRVVVRETWRHI